MHSAVGPLRADLKVPMIATQDIGAAAADALTELTFRKSKRWNCKASATSTTARPQQLLEMPSEGQNSATSTPPMIRFAQL